MMGIVGGVGDVAHYDYFYLVLQWPQSFCNTGQQECYRDLPNKFTIHGMWPEKNGRDVPCPESSYRHFNFEEVYQIYFCLSKIILVLPLLLLCDL